MVKITVKLTVNSAMKRSFHEYGSVMTITTEMGKLK